MKKQMLKFILAVILLLMVVGCSDSNLKSPIDGISKATASRYRENEIMEYEGKRLEPAIGPRDNSINGVQYVDMSEYKLKISGLVDKDLDLKYSDVLKLDAYTRKITLFCVEGWDATILWKGVLLKDIMDLGGIKTSANTAIFHSVDGYTTSLPLDTIIDNQLILAYSANGLDLPPEMGYPFIVVAEDKLGYKWARWVSEIKLSDNIEYRGYWEEIGYDNDADL